MNHPNPKQEILIYQTDDGEAKVNVQVVDEMVWLTQEQMATLFGKSKSTINEHIKNIFEEQELQSEHSIRKFGNSEFTVKPTNYYNLDVIISVGYRVKSLRGTQFRIWATQRLKEYIIKGFTMDDERLKQGGKKARYFEELLQRIRDIRSSERNFYQKVTDIYATSVDYRKDDALTKEFFATVQNKMHYAIHGKTAAEVVNERPMTMTDWTQKLDDFLKLSEKQTLSHAGSVSAKQAGEKANEEYKKYRQDRDKNYISDFDREVKKLVKGTA